MRKQRVFLVALMWVTLAATAHAQCAPGIPSAGNPGCIPPDQANSPYSQDDPGVQAPSQPIGHWADRWGAASMESATAIAGTVEDQPSKKSAVAESLSRCSKNGGRQCELLFTFYNQCAAIAQQKGGGPVNWATAMKSEDAESNALSNCHSSAGCQIVYSRCSRPELIR